jgi:hypothetical protein
MQRTLESWNAVAKLSSNFSVSILFGPWIALIRQLTRAHGGRISVQIIKFLVRTAPVLFRASPQALKGSGAPIVLVNYALTENSKSGDLINV